MVLGKEECPVAVKIRLKRMGAKQKAFYRIVVADSRSPRDGRFIETIGTYNPVKTPHEVTLDEELALKWLGNGAIATDTVRSIFAKAGIIKKHAETKNKPKPKKASKPKTETKSEVTETKPKTTTKKATPKKTTPAKKTTTTKKPTTKTKESGKK